MENEKNQKLVRLTPDQFSVGEDGKLIIDNDTVAQAIQSQGVDVTADEAGAVGVTVSVGIEIGAN